VIWQWSIWLYLKRVYLIGWTFTGDLAVVYLKGVCLIGWTFTGDLAVVYLKGVYLIGWTFTGDLAVVYLAVFDRGLFHWVVFDRLDFYR
jgi:hypothetical protein